MAGDAPPRTEDAPVTLVTGASRGIGRHVALALAEDGHDVAFTARTVTEGSGRVAPRHGADGAATVPVAGSLERTRREVEARGRHALPVSMDLRDAGSVRDAAATVTAAWGPVAVLVNNAIAHLPASHAPLADLDPTGAAEVLRANFLHQVLLVQQLLPGMLAAGGATIVDVVSGAAVLAPPAAPGEGGWGLAYAASKAAFGRLSGTLNAEYGDRGIRAFDVDPGFVVTEASAARGGTDTIADRGFTGADVTAPGRVVCWLARDAGADRYLGHVVRAPRLAADLDEQEGT